MSTRSTIRRTQWDLFVDALAAGPRCWLEARPTQRAGTVAVRKATTPADTRSRRSLGELHANGTLTDEEFAAAKAKILGT